ATTFTDSVLTPDTYFYRVRACNSTGCSAYSNEATVTPSTMLSVSLTPNPVGGMPPLNTTLTASVTGTATGTINYTFWWNCKDPGTSVSGVTATCGDPTITAIGAKFNAVTATSLSVSHVYSSESAFTAKVIAERGTAPP